MNRKKTNYLVAILNIIALVSTYVLYFSNEYLTSSINGGNTIYNNVIIDLLLNNIQLIMTVVSGGVGLLNIICAVQNRKSKKVCFWQIVFGVYEICSAINMTILLNKPEIAKWMEKIIFAIIPIILAIINIILIHKNKPTKIQIISYIVTIIIVILDILGVIGNYWSIISIIMQFIHIHRQEKYIEEGTTKKIVNIILYYILHFVLTVGFLAIIIYCLLVTKINETNWKNQLSELYNNISTLQGVTNKAEYIPVEENEKYGFISKNGEEKITCEYDRVTYFFETELNGKTCYFALAKKGNEYYIISKSNQKIDISDNKYLKNLDDLMENQMIEMFNNDEEDNRLAYVMSFSVLLQSFTQNELELDKQVEGHLRNEINLQKQNFKYYYKNNNYTMILEPIEDEDYSYFDDCKFNVTIRKSNGEETSNEEYIPEYYSYDDTIFTFSDGSIAFKSVDEKTQGWYDTNGNRIKVSTKYEIEDVNEKHIIVRLNVDEENMNYFILDKSGKLLLKTDALMIIDDMYLIKNGDKKMSLYDKNLNEISERYDKIIPNDDIDVSKGFSSYN